MTKSDKARARALKGRYKTMPVLCSGQGVHIYDRLKLIFCLGWNAGRKWQQRQANRKRK